MSKRRGARGREIPREEKDGSQEARDAILDSTRREFVKRVGAAGLLMGMPGLPRGLFARAGAATGATETRTLFFNLSHMKPAMSTHFLYLAGRKYRLSRIAEQPDVLAFERRRNAFLASVPDDKITHHVQGVLVPLDTITLAYGTVDENTGSGTWAMTLMHFVVPQPAVTHAYAMARQRTPSGPLPLSNKRRRNGGRLALTEQDLRDELALVDTNSHAEALVGLHPDILSIEPDSGAHILTNYVGVDSKTQFLEGLLESMGPATTQNSVESGGWATLTPLGINPDTGKPFKKSDGLLDQFYPDWDPSIDQLVAPAVKNIHPNVKDDPSLGLDVTPYNLNDNPNNPVPPDQLRGKAWARHDGIPNVVQVARLRGSGPVVSFVNEAKTSPGLVLGDQPSNVVLPDGRVEVTVDNISNWFLRWLGVWVQFLEPNLIPIKANLLGNDTIDASPGPYPRPQLDLDDTLFVGVVSPAMAIAGIPVYPGKFSPILRIPTSASTMRLFYTGIGQSGARPESPTGIYGAGIAMTVAFNYGVVGLFMACGVSTYDPTFKLAISLGGGALAQEIIALMGTEINNASFFNGLLKFAMGFLRVLLQTATTKLVGKLVTLIATQLVAANLIDSIPIAGQIARCVAAVVGGIQLAETSIEVACSPAAYVFDVVETHDLSINILPDVKDINFPDPGPDHTLYYKVSYLFDNGAAHVADGVDVPDPTVKPIAITFPGVPRGGQCSITIGFYVRHSRTPEGQNDWCAAKGTTGLFDNTMKQAPDLHVTAIKHPIQATTQYLHAHKTALNGSGDHVWVAGAAAPLYIPPPNANTPSLGALNSITVRQGTSEPPQEGYVGYSWKAWSSGVNGCGTAGPGQFDQMANLNTDTGNDGLNAKNGYVNSASLCGYPDGVRIGYHLLTHNALNVYLDTTTQLLRQVRLDTPAFDSRLSNRAFGKLNLASDVCLLHPSGHIVSINNPNHKIEVLKLPAEPVGDTAAGGFHLARALSGGGSRPGLIKLPVAAAISADGVILILEHGNNRIQAFDLGGNPVPFFKQQSSPYFLPLDTTDGFTYLDIAVEFTGYLYVLSMDPAGHHQLDIYHPGQLGTRPICTTLNFNGARLAVDFWRTAYTLNYEVLQLAGNVIPPFTEPSLSRWVPSDSNDGLNRRDPRRHPRI